MFPSPRGAISISTLMHHDNSISSTYCFRPLAGLSLYLPSPSFPAKNLARSTALRRKAALQAFSLCQAVIFLRFLRKHALRRKITILLLQFCPFPYHTAALGIAYICIHAATVLMHCLFHVYDHQTHSWSA